MFTTLAKDGLIFRCICPKYCRMYIVTALSLSDADDRESRDEGRKNRR